MSDNRRCYVDLFAQHSEVSGSCFLMVIKLPSGKMMKGMVDIGLFQDKEYEEENRKLLCDPKELDFVILTHAHIDHIGRLPLLYKEGYRGKTYTTTGTAILLKDMLENSFEIQKNQAKRNNLPELFSMTDVALALDNVQANPILENGRTRDEVMFHINEHVRITYLSNAHLVGACMVFLEVQDYGFPGVNLLFTGDYNRKNTFVKLSPIPNKLLQIPKTVICESTYGNTSEEDVNEAEPEKYAFILNIVKALQEGKSVIIYCFALGRMQEVQYMIKCAQEEGLIDRRVPVRSDGKLGQKNTMHFLEDLEIPEETWDFLPANHSFVYKALSEEELKNPFSGKISRDDVLNYEGQQIIITTSGWATFGPAQVYLPKFIERKDFLHHFTSRYFAPGTLARRLWETPHGEFVLISKQKDKEKDTTAGILKKKLAEVKCTSQFSGHGWLEVLLQMLGYVDKYNNVNGVIINHGDSETKVEFAKHVYNQFEANEHPTDVVIIDREIGYRISHKGIEKQLSTVIE